VRTAGGTIKRRDGKSKSDKTGNRQVPRFDLLRAAPGSFRLASGDACGGDVFCVFGLLILLILPKATMPTDSQTLWHCLDPQPPGRQTSATRRSEARHGRI